MFTLPFCPLHLQLKPQLPPVVRLAQSLAWPYRQITSSVDRRVGTRWAQPGQCSAPNLREDRSPQPVTDPALNEPVNAMQLRRGCSSSAAGRLGPGPRTTCRRLCHAASGPTMVSC